MDLCYFIVGRWLFIIGVGHFYPPTNDILLSYLVSHQSFLFFMIWHCLECEFRNDVAFNWIFRVPGNHCKQGVRFKLILLDHIDFYFHRGFPNIIKITFHYEILSDVNFVKKMQLLYRTCNTNHIPLSN